MSNSHKAWIFILQLFFALMLILPTSFQFQRGVFLLVIVMFAIPTAFYSWRINKSILYLWFACFLVGMIGVLIGVINLSPGALRVTTVYLVWPFIYLIFIGLAHDLKTIKYFQSTLLFGIIITTFASLLFIFIGILGYGNIVYPLFEFQGVGFGGYDGFLEYRAYNLTTVIYSFPFVFSLIIVRRDELKGWRKLGFYCLLLSIVLVGLGSGRRAFWLSILITPLILLPVLQISASRVENLKLIILSARLAVLGLLSFLGVVYILGLDIDILLEIFISAFQGKEISSGLRFEQSRALWSAFIDSPIIGQGLGSTVSTVRSEEQPWAYELSYLALLMNVGIVGFLVYLSSIFWVVFKGITLSRENREFSKIFIPLVVALCAFLVANGTNPYLSKFDYLWVIFLPVSLINAYLTQRIKND